MLIYLDNASTTKICDAAKQTIIDYLDDYGNPSSTYEFGRKSKLLIEDARERIANCINATPDEIFFTSGGSESNTMALNKYFSISTPFEHHSVQAKYKHIYVGNDGLVNCKHIERQLSNFADIGKSLKPNLLSCIYVNNEIALTSFHYVINNPLYKRLKERFFVCMI